MHDSPGGWWLLRNLGLHIWTRRPYSPPETQIPRFVSRPRESHAVLLSAVSVAESKVFTKEEEAAHSSSTLARHFGSGGGGGWRWSIGMQQLLRASDVSGRGRGLVAVKPLAGGQLVLRESPLLVYAEAEAAACGHFCAHCARCLTTSSVACGICFRVRFCGPGCRVAAEGSSHTPLLCSALTRLVRLGLEHETETQGRFLIAAFGLAARDPAAFQQLLLLYGQADAGDDPGGVASIVEGILRESTVLLEGKGFPCFFSVELMMALLTKDKKNAFGLMAPASQGEERKVRAYALYAQASLFNHDCLPNACRFEYLDEEPGAASNTDIHVRLLHDVGEGAEICLSYFPVNWTYFDRQKRLLEDYGFQCKCERCIVEEAWSDGEDMEQDDDEADAMVAEEEDQGDESERDDFPHAMFFVKYLCPAEACGGTMAPLPDGSSAMECNACGLLRTEEAFAQDLQQHGMQAS